MKTIQSNCLFIYDILDFLIRYLDIESLLKFMQICKKVHNYTYYDRYNYILCNKINKHFCSFNSLGILQHLSYLESRKILCEFYIIYRKYPDECLSSFLYEITNEKNLQYIITNDRRRKLMIKWKPYGKIYFDRAIYTLW